MILMSFFSGTGGIVLDPRGEHEVTGHTSHQFAHGIEQRLAEGFSDFADILFSVESLLSCQLSDSLKTLSVEFLDQIGN